MKKKEDEKKSSKKKADDANTQKIKQLEKEKAENLAKIQSLEISLVKRFVRYRILTYFIIAYRKKRMTE